MKCLVRIFATFLSLAAAFTALAASNQATGELVQIDQTHNSVTVSSECECGSGRTIRTTFHLSNNTILRLNGKPAKIGDLNDGDQVLIDYESVDEVTKITVTRE